MPVKAPKALSPGEELFALQCRVYNFEPEREFVFCEGRKWRFDFAFPESMVAIEIEGGTMFGKSRHTAGIGYEADCVKYNTAVGLGWRVYRFTTAMVKRGEAINLMLNSIFAGDM